MKKRRAAIGDLLDDVDLLDVESPRDEQCASESDVCPKCLLSWHELGLTVEEAKQHRCRGFKPEEPR